jgi:hypothetical protein
VPSYTQWTVKIFCRTQDNQSNHQQILRLSEGDDETNLDTAGIVVMSKRSFDVCFVIGFLSEVGDGRFDCCVVLFFVRELKILYKNVRESQRGCERKAYVVFPLVMRFECEFGDYAKVVASSLKMQDVKLSQESVPNEILNYTLMA